MDAIEKRLRMEASPRFWFAFKIGLPLVIVLHLFGVTTNLGKLSLLLESQNMTFGHFIGQWLSGIKFKISYPGVYVKSLERWDHVMIHAVFILGFTIMFFYARMRHLHACEILRRIQK